MQKNKIGGSVYRREVKHVGELENTSYVDSSEDRPGPMHLKRLK